MTRSTFKRLSGDQAQLVMFGTMQMEAMPFSRFREATTEGADQKGSNSRYEMRPVANMGDGTMSMMGVPICLR